MRVQTSPISLDKKLLEMVGKVEHSNANNLWEVAAWLEHEGLSAAQSSDHLPLSQDLPTGTCREKKRSTPGSDMEKVTIAIPYKAFDPMDEGKFPTSNSSSHLLRPTKRLTRFH